MADAGLRFDVSHTSVLARAVVTHHLALEQMGQVWLPVQRHWRLNERHYGALQGLDKKATTELHGIEQTKLWRRSYDVPPPPVDIDSPEHPINDPRYRLLPPDVLPAGECLKDVVARVLPYWHDVVAPQLLAGQNVLITAHGNSLRALVRCSGRRRRCRARAGSPRRSPGPSGPVSRRSRRRRRRRRTRSPLRRQRSPRRPAADRDSRAQYERRTQDVYALRIWLAKRRTSITCARFPCSRRVPKRTSKRLPRRAMKSSCRPAP